jgi:hypothetical protein
LQKIIENGASNDVFCQNCERGDPRLLGSRVTVAGRSFIPIA